MTRSSRARILAIVLVLALTAACGGETSTSDAGDGGTEVPQGSTETMPEPVSEAPAPETVATTPGEEPPLGGPSGDCGGEITLIDTNAPIDITMFDNRMYICVSILEGMSELTFEISELTGALNLYVGHPDLVALQAGGDGFWESEQGGRDAESITIEPGPDGFVDPGVYYIEVSGGASAEGAEFVLEVTVG